MLMVCVIKCFLFVLHYFGVKRRESKENIFEKDYLNYHYDIEICVCIV